MVCLLSGKRLLCSAICLVSLCLSSEACTFDNTTAIRVVGRVQYNSTSMDVSDLVPDSVPELSNCTYANSSSCCCHDTSTEIEYFGCSSLTDALDELNGMENVTSFALILGSENSTTVYSLSSYYQVKPSLASVVVVGFGDVTVLCGIGGKLLVNNSHHVNVQNVRWSQCGVSSSQPLAAVAVLNCPSVNFSNTHFLESGTTGLLVSITEVLPTPRIEFNFSNCTFSQNGNYITYTNGAGVLIQLTTTPLDEIVINFEDCHFTSNHADFGGAVYYAASSSCGTSQLAFSRCAFLYNVAESHGGAIYNVGSSSLFENCTFIGNKATSVAGAIYQIAPTILSSCQIKFQFLGCLWKNNTARLSAAMYTGVSNQFFSQTSHLTHVMIDCNFTHNSVDTFVTSGEPSCILTTKNVNAVIMENVLVAYNRGSGMCLAASSILVQENVTFHSNTGYLGGGMYVEDSVVTLNEQASLHFLNNKAVSGGALYQEGFLDTTVSGCFFVFGNQTTEEGSGKVYFINNTASVFGDSVYLTDPQATCDLTGPDFIYQPNSASQVASSARQVVFLDPVQSSGLQNLSLNLTLGQNIILHVMVLDYFNLSSKVEALITLAPDLYNGYRLNGIRTITLEDGMNNLNMYVEGPNISTPITDFGLQFLGDDISAVVDLVLNSCPAGFEYNTIDSKCSCVSGTGIVACDNNTEMACIKQGYWVGEYKNNTPFITAPCTSEACANANGDCPDCTLCTSNDLVYSCALPNNSGDQCVGSRMGFICSLCRSNYSFTFGGTECAPSSTCDGAYAIIAPFVDVIFLVLTMFILIVLLKMDYHINSGYLFSFIYYFSIISYLLPYTGMGTRQLKIIVSVFQSLTQMTPKFLGYVPFCFANRLTPLELQAILYVNPLLVSLAILLLLVLSRYCSVLVQFNDNTPVRAICLLLLLSFTAITTTTFNIINPTYINGVNGTLVYIQPTTSYLDASDHLPWFVIAIFVLVVLVVPFTLFLLVSPFLVRCFNLTKIKPFLDEFQGCYKDQFRWMAAYYFVCRLVYFAILTTPTVSLYYIQTQYVVQLVSFLFLMIHVVMQPYRSWLLNLIDTVILADIVLVTILYGETANVVFQKVGILRAVLAYVLVFIPVLYMLTTSMLGLWERWLSKRVHDWYVKHRFTSMGPSSGTPNTTVITMNEEGQSSRCNSLREPLLSLLAEDEILGPRSGRASSFLTERVRRFTHQGRKTSYTVVDRPWSSKRKGSSLLPNQEEENKSTRSLSNTSSNSRVRTTASSQDWQDHDTPQAVDEL